MAKSSWISSNGVRNHHERFLLTGSTDLCWPTVRTVFNSDNPELIPQMPQAVPYYSTIQKSPKIWNFPRIVGQHTPISSAGHPESAIAFMKVCSLRPIYLSQQADFASYHGISNFLLDFAHLLSRASTSSTCKLCFGPNLFISESFC